MQKIATTLRVPLGLDATVTATLLLTPGNDSHEPIARLAPPSAMVARPCRHFHDAVIFVALRRPFDRTRKIMNQELSAPAPTTVLILDFRTIWPDGSIRWIYDRGQVVQDRSGRPVRMLGIAMGITDA